MSTIITDNLSPSTGNTSLILDHDIDNLSLFRSDVNPQAVIVVGANSLYESFSFQALLFWVTLIFFYVRSGSQMGFGTSIVVSWASRMKGTSVASISSTPTRRDSSNSPGSSLEH